LIVGCSTYREQDESIVLPELIEQSALPAIPSTVIAEQFRVHANLFIDETGRVTNVNFTQPTGIESWDSLAKESIAGWRYTPALVKGRPSKVCLKQCIIVDVVQPVYLDLYEIVCASLEDANKIIETLNNGGDFKALASAYSTANSRNNKGYLGRTNINLYPSDIREKLQLLKENQYSQPIKSGDRYFIFKRDGLMI
jgi:parvulin-like peptidyl-prolyl isomerase